MGACFVGFNKEDCPRAELHTEYKERCKDAAHEHGHSYSGAINMSTGLEISRQTFTDENEADNWLADHAEKWGPAIAVKIESADKTFWLVGAWVAE